MAKCPSCNKFASLELQDPEVNNIDLADDRTSAEESFRIDYEVRIVRNSECCGDEIKEANYDGTITLLAPDHFGEGHELELEEDTEQYEEGGGRYKKSYYGFTTNCTIKCSCGQPVKLELEGTDADSTDVDEGSVVFTCKMAASYMDDLN